MIIYNASETTATGKITIKSPSSANLVEVSKEYDDQAKPDAVGLIIHLLNRYINDIPTTSELEKNIKKSLDNINGGTKQNIMLCLT
ncbi:MAG: hypothetical protein BWY74_01610 [Firmicutes bacterium ADurb.Bin419]|nr:MAG: hypothetical protein BWY74_01610 [Firmicutes bacterium ADurb.Bin419]